MDRLHKEFIEAKLNYICSRIDKRLKRHSVAYDFEPKECAYKIHIVALYAEDVEVCSMYTREYIETWEVDRIVANVLDNFRTELLSNYVN